jgi:hypothetical protein
MLASKNFEIKTSEKRENHQETKSKLVFFDHKLSTEIGDNLNEMKEPNDIITQKDENFELSPQELHTRKQYLAQIVNKTQQLHLEVINSTVLPQGLILKINSQGIENSLRSEKDGFVYFGCEASENPAKQNDYLIRLRDQENDERTKGRHFKIRFDTETKEYFLKDLGCGFGTFLKVRNEIVLRNNALINIGDSYIVVTFSAEEESNSSNNFALNDFKGTLLNLKVFNTSEKKRKYEL